MDGSNMPNTGNTGNIANTGQAGTKTGNMSPFGSLRVRVTPFSISALVVLALLIIVLLWAGIVVTFLDGVVVATTFAASAWWATSLTRPLPLHVLSFVALGFAVVAMAMEGMPWQLYPWLVIALALAASAGLTLWRPGHSHRWSRILGRLGLVAGITLGGLALLTVSVPSLPQPSGPYRVGTQIFRWTDTQRAETFTADPQDKRQVVAQAWYPAAPDAAGAAQGQKAPYFEAQGRLPGAVGSLPPFFYASFGRVDTHATIQAPVSVDRPAWPILIFSPGLGEAREAYTALCTDLASRGYVVIALTHPYESAVSVLSDGRIVGQTQDPFGGKVRMEQLIDVRAADASFVLDQLTHLAQVEPASPLNGHIDLQHVGMVGHSVGGATSINVLAKDPRFLVGVNMDGTLFGTESSTLLNQPFLWLESDGGLASNYVQVRDQLLDGLQRGGALLIFAGSMHEGFTDGPAYFTAPGRLLIGSLTAGSLSLSDMTSMSGDTISAFVGPILNGPNGPTLEQVVAHYPAIKEARHIAVATPK